MLTLDKISKDYGKKKNRFSCLTNVSVSFNDSSLNLIVGKSGSGKTTLSNIIGGLDSQTSGKLFFNDIEISKKNIDGYRNKNVSFVFQQFNLIESFTIKENFKIAFDLCQKTMDENVLRSILEKVSLLDNDILLSEFLSRYPKQLSVGQKQRVAIAIALVKNPSILILDEPTSALDEANSNKLVSLVKELSKSITVIITSHNKELFIDYADQVIGIVNKQTTILKAYEEKDECETTPNIKRGFFSFKETLKIALLNLKNKKMKLGTSLILSTLTVVLFGLAFLFQTCDVNEVRLRTQIQAGIKDALIVNTDEYYNHASYFHSYKKAQLSESQISYIENYTEGKCAPYYSYYSNLSLGSSFASSTKDVPSFLSEYLSLYYYVEVDSNSGLSDLSLTRYSELQNDTICRLPEKFDEVAISDLAAEVLKDEGLIQYINASSETITYVKSVDELIGLKLRNGLTITGIYSTSDNALEFWKPYLGKTYEDLQEFKNYEYINNARNGFSLSQCMLTKSGFSKSDSQKGANNIDSSYYVSLKGNYRSDFDFINSFKNGFRFVELQNWYSGYTNIIETFTSYFRVISWIVITILILVSFIITLNFFYSNIKAMEKDLGIFKAMGASKIAIALIILIQSLIVSVLEVIVAIIALLIISMVINSSVSVSLLSLNISIVSLQFLILLFSALLVSLFTSRKALTQTPINVIQQ